MRYLLSGFVGSMLLAPVSVAAQEDPLELEPSSDWQLEYAPDACFLVRTFGREGSDIILRISKKRFGPMAQLTLGSEALVPDVGEVALLYLPGEQSVPLDGVAPVESRNLNGVVISGVPFGEEVGLERPDRMQFANVFGQKLTLHTGNLRPAINAMDTCMEDLYREWGVDPVVQLSLSRFARRENPEEIFRAVLQAYPMAMVRRGVEGDVNMTVVVGPDGRVAHCTGDGPPQYPQFLEAACKEMTEHARYEPALDAEGNPVATLDTMTTVYRLGNTQRR